MVHIGRLRDAPNPLQRQFARSAVAGSLFVGSAIACTIGVMLAFAAVSAGGSWTFVMLMTCALWVFATSLFHLLSPGRKMTTEERGSLLVVYMPWFGRSMQGRHSDTDDGIDQRTQPRNGTVPLGSARNPLQRLAVAHPLVAYLAGYTLLGASAATPLWSASSRVAAVLVLLAVAIGLGAYLRSDLRRMSGDQRARVQVLHLWPVRTERLPHDGA